MDEKTILLFIGVALGILALAFFLARGIKNFTNAKNILKIHQQIFPQIRYE